MISVFVQSVTNGLDDVVQIWLLQWKQQTGLHLSELPFARTGCRSIVCSHTDPDWSVLGKCQVVFRPCFEEGFSDPDFVHPCLVRCDGPELRTALRQIRPRSGLPLRIPRDEEFDCHCASFLQGSVVYRHPIQRSVVYEFRVSSVSV